MDMILNKHHKGKKLKQFIRKQFGDKVITYADEMKKSQSTNGIPNIYIIILGLAF